MKTAKKGRCATCQKLICKCAAPARPAADEAPETKPNKRRRLAGDAGTYVHDFCETCRESSSASSAGNVSMWNGVGLGFLGKSDWCGQCRSYVKTLWVWCLIPLWPAGSYRVIDVGMGDHSDTSSSQSIFSRRVPMRLGQVVSGYLFALILLAVIAAVIYVKVNYIKR